MQEVWIVGVDHARAGGPIVQVVAAGVNTMPNADGNLPMGAFQAYTREQVLLWLRQGHTVFTATKRPGPTTLWDKGARVIFHSDPRYITTEANPREYDNLGNLPACATILGNAVPRHFL